MPPRLPSKIQVGTSAFRLPPSAFRLIAGAGVFSPRVSQRRNDAEVIVLRTTQSLPGLTQSPLDARQPLRGVAQRLLGVK